jgi:hypothetical protein
MFTILGTEFLRTFNLHCLLIGAQYLENFDDKESLLSLITITQNLLVMGVDTANSCFENNAVFLYIYMLLKNI